MPKPNITRGDEISNLLMRFVGLSIMIYFAVTNKDVSNGWLGAFGILFGVASVVSLRIKEKDRDE